MTAESDLHLIDQGIVISSSPGLDIVELPANRYMFGEYDMRNPADRKRFECEAPGDLKLEYRKQLQNEELGLGSKQVIWIHKYPHWEAKQATGELVLVDFNTEMPSGDISEAERQVA